MMTETDAGISQQIAIDLLMDICYFCILRFDVNDS